MNREKLKYIAKEIAEEAENKPYEFWENQSKNLPSSYSEMIDGKDVSIEIDILELEPDYIHLIISVGSENSYGSYGAIIKKIQVLETPQNTGHKTKQRNEWKVTNDNNYIGAKLYIDLTRGSECLDFIEHFILETSGTEKPVSFPFYKTTSGKQNWFGSRKQRKIMCVENSDIIELHQQLLNGDISILTYFSNQVWNTYKIYTLYNSFIEVNAEYQNQMIVIFAFPKPIADNFEIVELVKKLTEKCGCNYAQIVSGPIQYVESLFDFQPIAWESKNPIHGIDWAKDIDLLISFGENFVDVIHRAAWGNILSSSHVEKLGGIEKIKKESGAFLVEVWNDNVYIQLSESPWCFKLSDIIRLDEFLRPAKANQDWQNLYWAPIDNC